MAREMVAGLASVLDGTTVLVEVRKLVAAGPGQDSL
jgi:hypothetical protein